MSGFKLSCTTTLDDDLLARVRRIVANEPTLRRAAAILGTTLQTLEDALTNGRLKPATIDRIRSAVEAHERKTTR